MAQFVAVAAGAALVSRPQRFLRCVVGATRRLCTVSGAVGLTGWAFVVTPYVWERAPLPPEKREVLMQELNDLLGSEVDAESAPDKPDMLSGSFLTRIQVQDLKQPLFFFVFCELTRNLFACYSDAAGLMTPVEFRCALFKVIDLWFHYRRRGTSCKTADNDETVDARHLAARVRANAVRELVERVAGGAFRLIDDSNDGAIDATEFVRAVLLVLVVACGQAAQDAPMLRRLAFRLVDENGDGYVDQLELTRWVELAIRFDTAPAGALIERRGPFGMFGTRTLTPAKLAAKWFSAADSEKKRRLTMEQFAPLVPKLQLHEVVRRLARNFANERLRSE